MLRLSKSSHKQLPKRLKARNREDSTKPRRKPRSELGGEIRKRRSLVDRISILPDELLSLIISRLTFKQAAATCVLSRRWRYTWTSTTRLDFDGTKSLANHKSTQALEEARSKYVTWVNHVIALREDYTAPLIEFFRIRCDLDKSSERYIDEWVRYALERKVQILELDLTNDAIVYRNRRQDEYYTFPFKFLSRENGDCSNYSQPWSLRRCNSIHLKKLLLSYITVNDEAVEFILYNCPLLEDLSVTQSAELSTLKISGQFPSLRCLEICRCINLSSVEIRDSNIVSLKYRGRRIHCFLENVPMLVNVTLEATQNNVMNDVVPLISGILPQLETFKIYADMISWKETRRLYSSVKLSNLKELVVHVSKPKDDSFLPITNLIHASPCLERLVIETVHEDDDFDERNYYDGRAVSYHTHLKELRYVCYRGAVCDMELVMHLAKNVVSLEKIVIDVCRNSFWMPSWKYIPFLQDRAAEDEWEACTRAEHQLRDKLPPRIHLEIP